MSLRYYSNAPSTTLTSNVTSSGTLIQVVSVTGFPTLYPYVLILDKGQSTEEVVEVTAAAGTNLTVTRGVDSTTAFAHSAGAVVAHGVSARDIREANAHVNASSAVHGVTSTVVGTTDAQTLTNKTISNGTVSGGTVTNAAITGSSTYNAKSVATQAETTGTIPLTVTGILSQTADLVKVQKSDATKVVSVSKDGRIGILTNGAPSAAGLWLKAAATGDVTLRLTALASQTGDALVIADSSNTQVGSIGVDGKAHLVNLDSDDYTDWANYSPAFSNHGGTVTSTGRWKRNGKKTVKFTAEASFSTAGSGSSNVQFQLPTAPKRDVRISFTGHSEFPAGGLHAVTFTGGSGTTVDRILFVSDVTCGNLVGSQITANTILTISGEYEEA